MNTTALIAIPAVSKGERVKVTNVVWPSGQHRVELTIVKSNT